MIKLFDMLKHLPSTILECKTHLYYYRANNLCVSLLKPFVYQAYEALHSITDLSTILFFQMISEGLWKTGYEVVINKFQTSPHMLRRVILVVQLMLLTVQASVPPVPYWNAYHELRNVVRGTIYNNLTGPRDRVESAERINSRLIPSLNTYKNTFERKTRTHEFTNKLLDNYLHTVACLDKVPQILKSEHQKRVVELGGMLMEQTNSQSLIVEALVANSAIPMFADDEGVSLVLFSNYLVHLLNTIEEWDDQNLKSQYVLRVRRYIKRIVSLLDPVIREIGNIHGSESGTFDPKVTQEIVEQLDLDYINMIRLFEEINGHVAVGATVVEDKVYKMHCMGSTVLKAFESLILYIKVHIEGCFALTLAYLLELNEINIGNMLCLSVPLGHVQDFLSMINGESPKLSESPKSSQALDFNSWVYEDFLQDTELTVDEDNEINRIINNFTRKHNGKAAMHSSRNGFAKWWWVKWVIFFGIFILGVGTAIYFHEKGRS